MKVRDFLTKHYRPVAYGIFFLLLVIVIVIVIFFDTDGLVALVVGVPFFIYYGYVLMCEGELRKKRD